MTALRCNIPSATLPPCDLPWGHSGRHSNDGDEFFARDYDAEHLQRQQIAKRLQQAERERDEFGERLARIADLAHDRDGDTLEDRSKRLGQCAQAAFLGVIHGEELDRALVWGRLAEQLSKAETERDTARSLADSMERDNSARYEPWRKRYEARIEELEQIWAKDGTQLQRRVVYLSGWKDQLIVERGLAFDRINELELRLSDLQETCIWLKPVANTDAERLTCIVCEHGHETHLPPPEWLVTLLSPTATVCKGLHEACWRRHAGSRFGHTKIISEKAHGD